MDKNIKEVYIIELSICNIAELSLLAQLNYKLYEDEQNDNIPTIDIMEEKLKVAINNGSIAYLFKEENMVVGYALVKTNCSPFYLSHFFICKEARKKHLGTAAFHRLMAELKTETIDLDVFVWNHRGQGFWKSLGFEDRCIIMRRK